MTRMLSLLLFLLSCFFTIRAQTQVKLDLYTDFDCQEASTENPTINIPINECLVTTGLGSVGVPSVPCQNGVVNIIAFGDASCGITVSVFDSPNGKCWFRTNGAIAAVLLTCVQDGGYDAPTVTSTIAVGPIADAAPTGTQSTSSPTSPSGVSATTTGSSAATSTAATDGPGGGSTTSSSSSSSSFHHLSSSDIIAIAAAVGGIAATFLACWFGIRSNRKQGDSSKIPWHYQFIHIVHLIPPGHATHPAPPAHGGQVSYGGQPYGGQSDYSMHGANTIVHEGKSTDGQPPAYSPPPGQMQSPYQGYTQHPGMQSMQSMQSMSTHSMNPSMGHMV